MQIEIFSKVKDPRDLGKVKHELEDVLRMALIGVLCDCEDCDDISDMVTDREEEFKAAGLLKLTNGVPCGDTILRVVESVNPVQLRASLDCCRGDIIEFLCGHQVIIDGKKLRGENPKSLGCHGLYILNAWVSETEICVAEKPVDDKTNELTVLPSVLSSLWLTGSLVSIDAMGTHRNIADQIILQGGDYLMALKDNQPILRNLIENIFRDAIPMSVYTTEEKGHGRLEKRTCSIIDATLLEQEGMYERWPGLKRIIRMERERTENGSRSRETIYYLSSVEKDEAFYYASRIRAHWGIENKLHWHLDVTFREDMCRVRAKNGAVNFSAMRKYALEMLKKQDDKLSLKRRRKKCGRNIDYLLKVFKES